MWLLDATQAMKQSEREVLEESPCRVNLPVQMLVNKADRLGGADLARVMASVTLTLETTKVGLGMGPSLALSAKKALASKMSGAGDAALAESGWPPVQTLLEEQIVARSAELKERALRRRAAALVNDLQGAWSKREAGDRADAATQALARTPPRAQRLASNATPTASPSGSPNRCRRTPQPGHGTSSSFSSAATRKPPPAIRCSHAIASIGRSLPWRLRSRMPCQPSCLRSIFLRRAWRPAAAPWFARRRGARRPTLATC